MNNAAQNNLKTAGRSLIKNNAPNIPKYNIFILSHIAVIFSCRIRERLRSCA